MKRIFMIVVATFLLCNVYSQSNMDVTWLPSQNEFDGLGVNGTMEAFMEFDLLDIRNFQESGSELSVINSVSFHIMPTYSSTIQSAKIVIRQGATIGTSTVMYEQSLSSVVGNWNTVTLTTPYTIDNTQILYIGYSAAASGTAIYPFSVADCSNPKQGLYRIGTGNWGNITGDYGGWGIKANVATVTTTLADEISLQSLDIPAASVLGSGSQIEVKGHVKNLGNNTITSFDVQYSINGNTSTVETIAGINLVSGDEYDFTHPVVYPISASGIYTINVTISNPNGIADITSNNTASAKVLFASELVNRVVLHESFTSSTCGPCRPGNIVLEGVLNANDQSKWANIRYQMNWPGTGDPYYTAEGGVRRDYYGVNAVPWLFVDGLNWNDNSNAYNVAAFNAETIIPASVKINSVSASVAFKTVNFDINFTPVVGGYSNIRFFAAVVENETTKNKKSNGETLFKNVLKKFLTPTTGVSLTSFVDGTAQQWSSSYTFNGPYRLPSNANNPINHLTENSVEEFSDLSIIYWWQDYSTKEVLQAGRATTSYNWDIPTTENPGITSIYPNPVQNVLYVQTDNLQIKSLEIFNQIGQRVGSVNNSTEISTDKLSAGIYILRITSENGVSNHKFIKK